MLDWMYDKLFEVVDFFLSLIPVLDLGISEEIDWFFSTITNLLEYSAYFIPLGTVITILLLVVMVSNFTFVLWIANWIIKRIRGG